METNISNELNMEHLLQHLRVVGRILRQFPRLHAVKRHEKQNIPTGNKRFPKPGINQELLRFQRKW